MNERRVYIPGMISLAAIAVAAQMIPRPDASQGFIPDEPRREPKPARTYKPNGKRETARRLRQMQRSGDGSL